MRLWASGFIGFIALYPIWINPTPVAAEPSTHVHTSQRYDRPTPLLSQDIRRATALADVVTLTEVQGRRAAVHARGWGAYTDGRTDLGVMWRRDRWRLVHARAFPLARPPADRPIWALAVVLDPRPPHAGPRLLVTVAHMPSAVQWGDSWNPHAPRRVAAWTLALATWHDVVRAQRLRYRPGAVLTVADWNLDLRRPMWRAVVRRAFPTQRLTWTGRLPARGTHAGGRLIDGSLTTESGRARLLPRTAASDHSAYSERLTLDGPPPKGVASAP